MITEQKTKACQANPHATGLENFAVQFSAGNKQNTTINNSKSNQV